MILRNDRIATELPPPSDPDPAGAAAVQELLGGRFGEMSTFMNYTFQSFNFRGRQGARPFFDLVANIAAEEFGHVELVATTINTMLTGATPTTTARRRATSRSRGVKGIGNPQHFLAGGQGALPQDSNGRPWNGDYVFSSGDLVEDLTHNFFLETGARNNKLKVYEMVEHPAARALTGYLLVRGGVHQVAYARALENLTGADLMKLFPTPRIPTEKIPECKPHIKRGEHLRLYRFSPDDYRELAAVFNGPHPGDRRGARGRRRGRPRARRRTTCRRSPRSSRRTTRPRRSPRSPRSCASAPASQGADGLVAGSKAPKPHVRRPSHARGRARLRSAHTTPVPSPQSRGRVRRTRGIGHSWPATEDDTDAARRNHPGRRSRTSMPSSGSSGSRSTHPSATQPWPTSPEQQPHSMQSSNVIRVIVSRPELSTGAEKGQFE